MLAKESNLGVRIYGAIAIYHCCIFKILNVHTTAEFFLLYVRFLY